MTERTTTDSPKKKDFFISYTGVDEPWAEWIAWELEEAGYTTELQAWDIVPGLDFGVWIHRALSEANRLIAVLSPDYMKSQFCIAELSNMWANDPAGAKHLVIPVRVRECRPEGLLRARVYIDLVGLDEEQAKHRLLKQIEDVKARRAKPAERPLFPDAGAPFPGAMPAIWNVPFNRNRSFTDGKERLEGLCRALTDSERDTRTVALTGLGGVGKTQLAVQYAHKHCADYSLIWWIRAEEPSTLVSDYAALAQPLDLPAEGDEDQELAVEQVCRCLRERSDWLLVFDNVVQPQDIEKCLPEGGNGHIIVTSRDTNWRAMATTLDVEVFNAPEAVEFLQKRTGENDKEASEKLAEEVGYLALALEQAGAYIEESVISISNYLGLFQRYQERLLGEKPHSGDYGKPVFTTWDLSFKRVKDDQESPGAAELLTLCSFLAPDEIPREMLAHGTDHLPNPLAGVLADPLKCNKAVAALRRHSLLKVEKQALTVHRLVQMVTRDRLEEDELRTWAVAAVSWINHMFPFDGNEPQTWPLSWPLIPHALTAAQHAEKLTVVPETTARLLEVTGSALRRRGDAAEAGRVKERALKIAEAAYGADDPALVAYLNAAGNMLLLLRELARAEDVFKRSLKIAEAAFGEKHDSVARALIGLGEVLNRQGHAERALTCHERAVVMVEDAEGPRRVILASALGGLGMDLNRLGFPRKALACHERALDIDEATYGRNHRKVSIRLDDVGFTYELLGDLQEARRHYEEALRIDKQILGPRDPTVGFRLNAFGRVLRELGELHEARECFEQALSIYEAAYGPDSPRVAAPLRQLGGVFRDLGDLNIAQRHLERALAISEKKYRPDHDWVALCLNILGRVLHDSGDLRRARKHFERALDINEKVFGPNHYRVATSLSDLGCVLLDLGDTEEAGACHERALAIDLATYEDKHPKIARDLNNLGKVLLNTRDLGEALSNHNRALAILKETLGPRTPKVAETLANIGDVLKEQGDLRQAKVKFQQALAIFRDLLGEDHPKTVAVRDKIADLDAESSKKPGDCPEGANHE